MPTKKELKDTVRRAVKRERERCAKVAENYFDEAGWHQYYKAAGGMIGSAIRHPQDEVQQR